MRELIISALESDCRQTMQALSKRLFMLVPGERERIFDMYRILSVFLKLSPDVIDDNLYLIYARCNDWAKEFLAQAGKHDAQ